MYPSLTYPHFESVSVSALNSVGFRISLVILHNVARCRYRVFHRFRQAYGGSILSTSHFSTAPVASKNEVFLKDGQN
jgi:hypothetical protein